MSDDPSFMTAGYAAAAAVSASVLTFLSTRIKVRAETEVAVQKAVYEGFEKLIAGMQQRINYLEREVALCREEKEKR